MTQSNHEFAEGSNGSEERCMFSQQVSRLRWLRSHAIERNASGEDGGDLGTGLLAADMDHFLLVSRLSTFQVFLGLIS